MENKNTKKYFDGTTDVEAFITITELNAALKGHTDEKKAQYFASLLVEGPALNVYLRLNEEKRKDADEIKAALRSEFEAAHRDREVALDKLAKRTMSIGESPFTFAYALQELTKLAYSTLPAPSQDAIGRDYFVKGQSKEMQIALKSLPDFGTKSMMDLAKEAVRFQTAGIPLAGSSSSTVKTEIQMISSESDTLVDSIVERVVARLENVPRENDSNSIDYIQQSDRRIDRNNNFHGRGSAYRGRGNTGRGGYRGSSGRGGFDRGSSGRGGFSGNSSRGGSNANQVRGGRNCRNCRSPEHGYIRCPTRFCQACGGRGHDAWSRDCPNF